MNASRHVSGTFSASSASQAAPGIRWGSPITPRGERAEAVGVKRGKGLHHWRGRDLADGVGEDAVDPDGIESLSRREHRAVDIDAAAGIFDHEDVEALTLGILGRIADAEVEASPARNTRVNPRSRRYPANPVWVLRSFSKNAE